MAVQKKPRPEPAVSTAWWNNEAFHGMLGAVKGALQGALIGVVAVLLCTMAGWGALGGLLFIAAVAGMAAHGGFSAYSRALVADKPKAPSHPKPYDPARTARIMRQRGGHVPVQAAPNPTSIATTPPPPAPPVLAQSPEPAAKSELSTLSTRYREAIAQEREKAAGVENVRGS